MATTRSSTLGMAFAGKTASVDIPKPRDGSFFTGRETFAAVAAKSLPNKNPPTLLPTPPNSISPNLPPRGFTLQHVDAPDGHNAPDHVDSDVDLQDAAEHMHGQDQTVEAQHGFPGVSHKVDHPAVDSAGAITSALLAKHHLPDILLAHGPLAIRHVMGYLTTSVPGFSRIPPAKARRLVVGALEGRGNGGEGGGMKGDVEFEKVGWGRWDARVKGQPSRDPQMGQHLGANLSPPASMPSSYNATSGKGMAIPKGRGRILRCLGGRTGTSWAGDSAAFSHDEELDPAYPDDVTMLEHEADKMSLDEDASCSSSEAPDDGVMMDEDLDEMTDEEDWASIGAVALRQASLPAPRDGSRYLHAHILSRGRGGGPPTSSLAKSAQQGVLYNIKETATNNDPSRLSPHSVVGLGVGSDSQEREAVEALLRLRSV